MVMRSQNLAVWPSGDCMPVMGVQLTLEALAERIDLKIFRASDDLDAFVGAIVRDTQVGPVLVMRYDHAPADLTMFYVDVGQNPDVAQVIVASYFCLEEREIAWRREA